jgi:outer membrane protein assembly factor BamE (lipoprotein component of BamABCDE complex)
MGTPVYVNTFRDNEWDYVYTYQKYGHRLEESKVIVHFSDGQVDSVSKDLNPRMNPLTL